MSRFRKALNRSPAANPPEGPNEFIKKMQKLKAEKGIEAVVKIKQGHGRLHGEHLEKWRESDLSKEMKRYNTNINNHTEKGKNRRREYVKRDYVKKKASERAKRPEEVAKRKAHRAKPEVRERLKIHRDKYLQSEKGKKTSREYAKTDKIKQAQKEYRERPEIRKSRIKSRSDAYRKIRLEKLAEGVHMPRVQNRPTEGSEKKLVKGRKHGDVKVDPKNIDYGGKMGPIPDKKKKGGVKSKGGSKTKFSKVLRKMKGGGIGSPFRFGMKPSKKE